LTGLKSDLDGLVKEITEAVVRVAKWDVMIKFAGKNLVVIFQILSQTAN
jgi:hypothetical protein